MLESTERPGARETPTLVDRATADAAIALAPFFLRSLGVWTQPLSHDDHASRATDADERKRLPMTILSEPPQF